jgi:nitroreductase
MSEWAAGDHAIVLMDAFGWSPLLCRNRGEFKPRRPGLSRPEAYASDASHLGWPSMTDALALLQTRRSVKPQDLAAPGPSASEIDTLLTIAARVPDHGKLTPWRFIIFEGERRLAAGDVIAAVFAEENPDAPAERVAAERTRLARAPLVIAVVSRAQPHPKIPEWEQQLSAAAAATNLLLAAHALGYAACWLTEWYAFDRRVLERLGVSEAERITGFVHIGTPAGLAEDRPRPPLDTVATRY